MARAPLRDTDPAQVGRYRLTARLGAGGMGVVYLGTDLDGSLVAVKVLRPELTDDPEFRDRFGREVINLTRVKGVCTVQVIEADTESARPFMVTEYVSGPSLSEYVARYGPPGPDMMYGLATGLAEALTAIHTAGVVHRDLKPSNVILGHDGPDTYSVTMNGRADSVSASITCTVHTPLTRVRLITSRPNRSRNSGSSVSSGRSTLTATRLPSRSVPRYTTPMPPAPSRAVSR